MRRQWPWATNRWCWHTCSMHRNLGNSSTRWLCPCNSALSKSSDVLWDFLIRENCLVIVKDVASLLDISVGSAHHIIHDELKFWKVCARWLPKWLTPEMKKRCVVACQELLCQYEAYSEAFLQRTITGDDGWVHFYEPEWKRQSIEWHHTSSSKPKKVRVQRSAGSHVDWLLGLQRADLRALHA
jgi:hypothetical protein